MEKYPIGLHAYGGMTSKGLVQLTFTDGIIGHERYISEILSMLTGLKGRTEEAQDMTSTTLFGDDRYWIFEQDQATCHDNNIVQPYLMKNVSDFFSKFNVSAKIDDLSCIE